MQGQKGAEDAARDANAINDLNEAKFEDQVRRERLRRGDSVRDTDAYINSDDPDGYLKELSKERSNGFDRTRNAILRQLQLQDVKSD